MRRFIALLGLIGFTNLSVLQPTGSCPLAGEQEHEGTSTILHDMSGEHAGHSMPAESGTETVADDSNGESGHPSCLMTGPCGLNVDVGRRILAASPILHNDGVLPRSVLVPPSRIIAPDIPPPKA